MKIGIDIGGSHIGIGVVNSEGKILQKIEKDIPKQVVDKKKFILDYILENINLLLEKFEITKIGIAVPGTVKNGKIVRLINLDIFNFDIKKEIQKYYNIDITLQNDIKCAGNAEKQYGSLKQFKDCVFLGIGTGIGGAVFLNNKLLLANKNIGFELGHMIIQKNGKQCNCGKKGCFETYCSIKRFKDEVIKILKVQNIESKDIINLIKNNIDNKQIENLINNYIENMIIGLSNIIDIFEPESICFGGSFVYFKDIIFNRLVKEFANRDYVYNKGEKTILTLATLKNDAGIIGT